MKKTTKKQALALYDEFHGVLRFYNGGTQKENERMAGYCYSQLSGIADQAATLAANPGKLLRADAWLWKKLTVTIPARVQSFKVRYNL